MSVANCPACAGPVEFAIGSSAVVVCNYCRSVVARTDRGVEDLGKVSAIIDTGSPLRVGVAGKYAGRGFRVTGRTQLRHQAGGVWDEWYVAFDDTQWGWLAEAQGNFYLTSRTSKTAPAYAALQLGQPVAEIDGLVVQEIGTATLASAEGEIPWRPVPGSTYEYADLSGTDGKFATIDYSEEPPLVFKGWKVPLESLGVAGEPRTRNRVQLTKLSCSNCGGRLDLKAPDQAERVICPNCGAIHDVNEGGLKYLHVLKGKVHKPLIPLGSTGKIEGVEYAVAGFMQRSVKFDRKYYWTEYLLYAPAQGFRWLVHSDDHWSFITPVQPGEVTDPGNDAAAVHHAGRKYKIFQRAEATVEYVLGEFYWRVEIGEKVATADYIAPPYGLSREQTTKGAREITWSLSRYMQPEEVEEAFGVTVPRPQAIGPTQPFTGAKLGCPFGLLFIGLLVALMMLAATRPNRLLVNDVLELRPAETTEAAVDGQPAPDPSDPARVYFSKPFDLSGKYNVGVSASIDGANTWTHVSGDLVNETTGDLQSFDLPIEYYEGIDEGERWTEGSQTESVYLPPPPKGRYVVRFEPHWPRESAPPSVRVEVREGVVRLWHFALAFLLLLTPPIFAVIRRLSFESQRWKDSEFNPYASSSDDSDDDE